MGRAVVITCALALAGCQPGGVEIVVYAPPAADMVAIDEVRLLVGVEPITMNRTVWPPNPNDPRYVQTSPLTATAWLRDGASGLVAHRFPAHFTYEAGTTDQLGAVIAVGYANGTPVATVAHDGLAIPAGRIDKLLLGLDPADVVASKPASWRQLDRVAAWQPPETTDTALTCAYSKTFDASSSHMIVGADDNDCDGLANTDPLECLPDVYLGRRSATKLDELSCLPAPSSPQPGAPVECTAGGPTCTDGKPIDPRECAPTSYCVPLSACKLCAGSAPTDPYGCLLDIRKNAAAAMPHMHARYDYDVVMQGGTLQACPGTATVLVSDTFVCHVAGHDDRGSWHDKLQFDGFEFALAMTSPCTLSIAISGTSNSTVPAVRGGLLAIETDLGRGLLLPIELVPHVAPLCRLTPAVLTILDAGPGDGLFTASHDGCMQLPPVPFSAVGG